jgi:hypothetical protein
MREGFQTGIKVGFPSSLRKDLRRSFCVCTMRFSASGSAWKMDSGSPENRGRRIKRRKTSRAAPRFVVERIDRDADGCRDADAAARAWGYHFCFLRGEELRSLNCAFSFETSSRSVANSFCTPVDLGSPFAWLAGVGADGTKAERGIHGGRSLAADDAAAGRTEVK